MDVAANLLVRSANLGNAPISAVAKQPGQYEGVFNYSRNQIEDPAFGRQRFPGRYDQTLNLLRGGIGAAPGPAMGGAIARTGATGIGSGAHLDVRWADGKPITSADADRFIRVAGKLPSSYGVTSGYGPRQAPVPGASTFHKGVDFGTPAGLPITLAGGAKLSGAMTEAQSGGGGIVGIIDTPMGPMKLLHLESVLGLGTLQAGAAAQMVGAGQPQFNPTPTGATPAAAPLNAERMKVLVSTMGSEKEAQRILEGGIQLKQKGVELAQVEQILQSNQVPALQQEFAALQGQLSARQAALGLSNEELALADLQAESTARTAQIEKERASALAKVSKQYAGADLVKAQAIINERSSVGLKIAKEEEGQKRKNLELVNQIAGQTEANNMLLNARKEGEIAAVENAALLRGELSASAVELARVTDGYKAMNEQQRAAYETDLARTEELRKQNEILQGTNQINKDTPFIGAGLRAGRIGAQARGFEEVLGQPGGTPELANARADAIKRQEEARLVWDNLEKNIVDVSDAISGALTNGLVDAISGAREFEDVGRDLLNSISGSFADSAQQRLSSVLQGQLAGLAGGENGFLSKLFGAAPAAVTSAAGPQALGAASLSASAQLLAFSANLQFANAQMVQSSFLSGGGGFGSIFSSVIGGALGGIGGGGANFSSAFSAGASPIPGIGSAFTPGFGGFLANGGVTKPGEGYVVGEKEPEFFFPGVTGRVVPRSDMEKAAALQEDDGSNEPIDIRYTVTEQRGERYVTEEQFRKGMASTSKRAQAMTYAGMRNNKNVRDYVGV
jgi:hypothetical protein